MNQQIGFVGPSYTLRDVNVDCQRTVNFYPEATESGLGKNGEVAALVQVPGLVLKYTIGSGPIRALYEASNGRVFAVSGAKFYELVGGVSTERGTLSSDTGEVRIDDTGTDLCLVDGVAGYVFTFSTNAFAKIADPEFPKASAVSFIDQYIIVNDLGSGRFQFSALNNPASWDGLDVATAEGSPDDILTLIADHRELWLFGVKSTEVWFNSGDPDKPFQRISGAFMEQGIAAPASVAKIDNSMLWISRDSNGRGMVVRAAGYQAQRVSTFVVEQELSKSTDISGARAWTYQHNGHSFYCLNAPGLKSTWVLDIATGLWHERASLNDGVLGRHWADCHAFANGIHLVGDYRNGKIYELTEEACSEDGSPLVRERTTPHVSNNMERMFFGAAQVDFQVGFPAPEVRTVVKEVTTDAEMAFSDVVQYGPTGFDQEAASWSTLGNDATQTINADPSILLSTTNIDGATNDVVSGTFRVDDPSDDDFIGFAFHYQDDKHYYLFDWKGATQTYPFVGSPYYGLNAAVGMRVKKVSSSGALTAGDLWPSAGSANVTVLDSNSVPWVRGVDYTWRLEVRADGFTITIKQGSTVLATMVISDTTWTSGKFGMYNYSIADAAYSGFVQSTTTTQTVEELSGTYDPQIMLQWSDDGGHAWSNEHWVSAGRVGEYKRRAMWRRLGQSRNRVWKLRITDPVRITLISGFASVEGGIR